MKLLIATQNPGKIREFRLLLAPLDAAVCFPSDVGLHIDIPEDGHTYVENASQKALTYAQASGLLTLADDSGLEVDALGGAPGIHSARYTAGHDVDRVEALLTHLRDVPLEQRTARFRCIVVIASPDGETRSTEGICEGRITFEPAGQGGFGYDPVFFLPQYNCTMAQISEEKKNRISHRARAIAAALPILQDLVARDQPGGLTQVVTPFL